MSGYETDEFEEITEEWSQTTTVKKKKKTALKSNPSQKVLKPNPIQKVCINQIYPWHCTFTMDGHLTPVDTALNIPVKCHERRDLHTKTHLYHSKPNVKVEIEDEQKEKKTHTN